jgi:AcrR family transcriptional regulator
MTETRARPYFSAIRQQYAEATRRRVLDAGRDLLIRHGYDGTTIESIATAAGVSPQTVYVVFGSKRGLLAALLDEARFGPAYRELVARARQPTTPTECLQLVASIARRVYDAEASELDLLLGAGAVSPDLAALDREHELRRLAAQAPVAEELARSGCLRADLDAASAGDVIWALTGREPYRLLVMARDWSSDRYQAWLAETLIDALLAPDGRA